MIGSRICIHTGCTTTHPDYYEEVRREIKEHRRTQPDRFEHSAIIGTVKIAGVMRIRSDLSFFARFRPDFKRAQQTLAISGFRSRRGMPEHGQKYFTHEPSLFWWILSEPEPLSIPIPIKGRCNLWKPIEQI